MDTKRGGAAPAAARRDAAAPERLSLARELRGLLVVYLLFALVSALAGATCVAR